MTSTEKALLEIVHAMRKYLEDDSITPRDFALHVIEAVDNPDIAPVIAEIERKAK